MGWSILIAAICGGLAAAVAGYMTRRSHGRLKSSAIALVVFLAINFAAQNLLLPEVRAWQARRDVDRFLEETRIFSLLADRHPEVREQFADLAADLARRNVAPEQASLEAMALGRALVGPYFQRYARRAPGDALGRFAEASIDTMRQLETRHPDACHYWMFGGEPPPGFSYTRAVTPGTQLAMHEAMADVVESSIADPRDSPDPRSSDAARQALVRHLSETHGQDFVASLAMLEHPHAAEVDRRAACQVAIEFYRGALSLPEEERGVLLRTLFGASES